MDVAYDGLHYPQTLVGTVNVHNAGYHEVIRHSIGLLALVGCRFVVEFRPRAIGT